MSITYTSNLGLGYPAFGDSNWNTALNADLLALDGLAALGTLATIPRESPSTSLYVDVSAGSYRAIAGATTAYAGGAILLAATATNYVYLTDAGTLTANTSGFPSGLNVVPLATVVTGSSTVTSVADSRLVWRSMGGHPVEGIGTPTIAAGAGAGTAPTVSVSVASSDQRGLVTVLTGTSPTASAIVATITFGFAFPAAPGAVSIAPANAAAAALSGNAAAWADSAGVSTTAFTIKVGSTNLVASTTYLWSYSVRG